MLYVSMDAGSAARDRVRKRAPIASSLLCGCSQKPGALAGDPRRVESGALCAIPLHRAGLRCGWTQHDFVSRCDLWLRPAGWLCPVTAQRPVLLQTHRTLYTEQQKKKRNTARCLFFF